MEGLDETITFLRQRFSSYYQEKETVLPPRFGNREWGFFLWGGRGMFRHTAFMNKGKFRKFLIAQGPRHVYHSSAYYRNPGAPTMGQKGWLGADLIFDIDADHIEGHEKMTYKEQLANVKKEIVKLVYEYLLSDFSFEERYLSVVFSGGRGYHVHVRDPRVFELNSHERKEIVDYIMAIGIDEEDLYYKRPIAVSGQGIYRKVHERIILPDPEDGGWKGRFRWGISKYITELGGLSKKEALDSLMKVDGVGKITAEDIYHRLFEIGDLQRVLQKIDEEDTIEFFSREKLRNAFAKIVIEKNKISAGEADAPVTRDVNRLIRLPGSLHGKSSLRVIPLELDSIKDFEPLVDAVVFGDRPVKVVVKENTRFEINDERFALKAGKCELPEYAAVFLMAGGRALLDVER